LRGTLLGLDGNTWVIRGKNKKSLSPYLLKKKKTGPFMSVHDEPSHWLHEISITKTVHHHFWPGLMAGSAI